MFASHHKLNNLNIIVDNNKIQSMGFSKKIINLDPLKKKFLSFGCKVIEINGHNILKITKALKTKSKSKPKVIIANTIKGKDISFMENNNLWHYKNPNSKQLELAIKEINNKYA